MARKKPVESVPLQVVSSPAQWRPTMRAAWILCAVSFCVGFLIGHFVNYLP
jgi:hypothetical protein